MVRRMTYLLMSVLGIGGGFAILAAAYINAVRLENFNAYLRRIQVDLVGLTACLASASVSFDEFSSALRRSRLVIEQRFYPAD